MIGSDPPSGGYSLLRENHTSLGEQQLAVPEAQAEHIVEPDGVADDIRQVRTTLWLVSRNFFSTTRIASAGRRESL